MERRLEDGDILPNGAAAYANTGNHLVQLVREGDKLSWKSLGYTDRDATWDNE